MRKWSGLISDNALASCLGLVDESVKHWELDEIVTLRPDADIKMIQPLPLGKLNILIKFFDKILTILKNKIYLNLNFN